MSTPKTATRRHDGSLADNSQIVRSKRALLPALKAPEDFGRSYNRDRPQEKVGWVARLRSRITARGGEVQ
jgi:hypothetical protein